MIHQSSARLKDESVMNRQTQGGGEAGPNGERGTKTRISSKLSVGTVNTQPPQEADNRGFIGQVS